MSPSYKAAEGFLFFFFHLLSGRIAFEPLSFSIKRHIGSYLIAIVKSLGLHLGAMKQDAGLQRNLKRTQLL